MVANLDFFQSSTLPSTPSRQQLSDIWPTVVKNATRNADLQGIFLIETEYLSWKIKSEKIL